MILDILEQSDLFNIAKCKRKATLKAWLEQNRIAYLFDVKGNIIVHKKAIEVCFGVQIESKPEEVTLCLDDQNAA